MRFKFDFNFDEIDERDAVAPSTPVAVALPEVIDLRTEAIEDADLRDAIRRFVTEGPTLEQIFEQGEREAEMDKSIYG